MEISGTELICPLCRAPFDVLKKLGLLLLRTRCFRAFKISFVPKNPSCPKNSCFFNKETATRDVHLFANSRKMRCFALFLRILRRTKQRRAIWNRAKNAQNEQSFVFYAQNSVKFCRFCEFLQNTAIFAKIFRSFFRIFDRILAS